MRRSTRYALLAALSASIVARAVAPEHFSPSISFLTSASDVVVIGSVPDATASDGTVVVVIEEVWKGTAASSVRVVASAPWMSSPWQPHSGERFLLFMHALGPAHPLHLLDVGSAHFRVLAFTPPVVDVWPGLLPGTVLTPGYCQLVGSLNADGTISYKKVCTGAYTAPLSTVRKSVEAALKPSSDVIRRAQARRPRDPVGS